MINVRIPVTLFITKEELEQIERIKKSWKVVDLGAVVSQLAVDRAKEILELWDEKGGKP